jgi:glycosyltransferase involved in cell wall biosynthesis
MFALGLAPQKIGGIEKFLRYFVIALDSAGWDSVLCFDGPIATEFRDYIAGPYVAIESLDNQANLGFSCASELWKLLRKHKPQVFVYAFHSVLRCFPWLAKTAGTKRVFFNDHSSRPQGHVAAPLSPSKRVIGQILTAPLTAIVSVSVFTSRTSDAMKITSTRNIVVPNGVEVREIAPDRRIEFRRRYGISEGDIVVTQVCWMVEEKGVEVMLRAAAMVLRKYPKVRFVFVGDGQELPKYRKLAIDLGIDGAVTFTGLLNNPTDMGVFDASDIYCQPSVWQEACPLAVLEAMSVKLPVIASNTGGLPELVEDEVTGLLVPVGGSAEIHTALERLISDPSLRRRMGEAGCQSVLRKHHIQEVASKYVDIFIAKNN